MSGGYGFIAFLVFCFHIFVIIIFYFSKETVNCQYYFELLGCPARSGGSTQPVMSQVKVNFAYH